MLAACLQGYEEAIRENFVWFGRWWMNLHKRSCCSTWVLRKINMESAKDSRTNLFIREEWPFPAPDQGILINHQIYIYMNIRNYCYYIYIYTHARFQGYLWPSYTIFSQAWGSPVQLIHDSPLDLDIDDRWPHTGIDKARFLYNHIYIIMCIYILYILCVYNWTIIKIYIYIMCVLNSIILYIYCIYVYI